MSEAGLLVDLAIAVAAVVMTAPARVVEGREIITLDAEPLLAEPLGLEPREFGVPPPDHGLVAQPVPGGEGVPGRPRREGTRGPRTRAG